MLISTKEIEVRYAETDQMGVVYHANYLVWMELGRTQIIKDLGFSYAEMEKDGIISPVLDILASYKNHCATGRLQQLRPGLKSMTVSASAMDMKYSMIKESLP